MNNNQTTESLSRRGALRRFGKLAALTSAAMVFGDALQASPPVNPSEIHLDADKVYINNKLWFDTEGQMHIDSSTGSWGVFRATPMQSATGSAQSGNPAFSAYGLTNIYLNSFAQADQLFFVITLPNDWKEGSRIIPYVNWLPKVAMGNNQYVGWQLFISMAKSAAVFPSTATELRAYETSNVDTTSGATAGTNLISVCKSYNPATGNYDYEGLDMTGKNMHTTILCRLYRKTDTYNSNTNACLISLDFLYQRDGLGSSSQFSK